MEQLRDERKYTYADYCTWDDGERWELIDGVAHMMAPPSTRHQEISGEIFGQLRDFLRGKPCKVFAAPFGVRLAADDEDGMVVEPDLVVICNESKIDDKGCKGAPDLVVEILSPSSAQRDKWVKFHAYRRAGVREYWIVDPDSKTVTAHLLEGDKYTTMAYGGDDKAPVVVLPGCEIDLGDAFAGL